MRPSGVDITGACGIVSKRLYAIGGMSALEAQTEGLLKEILGGVK